MKPRTEVRVSELKNEHNGRNRTYDMRSEDRSATCCHHRYYHLCRKDNNNNLINKRYKLAASNRYKHLIGGFIVATLAGSFYAAINVPRLLCRWHILRV